MDAWFERVEQVGLAHGSSLDLDFHTVPANSAVEPLEKHYVPSRRRQGILVFLARDTEQRVFRCAAVPARCWGRSTAVRRRTQTWRGSANAKQHRRL
jgi:hypothetical protein